MSDALGPYPDPEARDADVHRAALAARGQVRCIGHSVEGREILAVELPSPGRGAPKVLVAANIHGPEFISGQVALGLVRAAAEPAPQLKELLRSSQLCVVPCLNPDGYARTVSAQGQGKLSDLRANARGVDLNRNYPLPLGARRWPIPGAGSGRPGAATYRGPEPLSEPETAALARYAAELGPRLSFGLHSFMGTVIPARVNSSKHYALYRQLCATIKGAQPSWGYRRLAARYLDVFTGEQEDFVHHHLDGWALCLETFTAAASARQHLRAPSLFWRFNPYDPTPWVDNDIRGIVAGALAALKLPRPSEV